MAERQSFLPDFCGIRPVFLTVLSAQLLAFVVTLVGAGDARWFDQLALNSLFIQWVALGCAALLCLARRWLAGAGDAATVAVALSVVALVTLVASETAVRLMPALGLEAGDFDRRVFALSNLAVALVIGSVALRYLYLQHHWRRRIESESEARVQALAARMRPHFLFNCMNTIASLTRSRPELAEGAIEDLADLLRASLSEARTLVPWSEELALCRRYLRIESLRLGARLKVDWDVRDMPADTLVPALSLQPMLENAIYHGIEPLECGGTIIIRARVDARGGWVEVQNPFDAAQAPQRRGLGMAQRNLRARLAGLYGARGRMTVLDDGGHYRVVLEWPVEAARHAHPGR